MMRTAIHFSIYLLLVAGANAVTLDELANDVSPLPTLEANHRPDMSTDVATSSLTQFAYKVGFDVSKLTTEQRSEIAADFADKPSWSFCDEHQGIEITMSGNSLWERTKLVQLQRRSGASLTH